MGKDKITTYMSIKEATDILKKPGVKKAEAEAMGAAWNGIESLIETKKWDKAWYDERMEDIVKKASEEERELTEAETERINSYTEDAAKIEASMTIYLKYQEETIK